jgi:RNA polymerase sigma factor (sigma-70 family)
VQDSLLEITRRIGRLRAAPAYVAWIFRIVKNTCDRAIRSMRRYGEVDELPSSQRDPGDPYALTMDLIAALESLPEHHREVVLMRDFREMTIEEMAVQLGISRQATKSRLHRARLLVREYLHA